jgi:TatA/E family protein of Tat protein translocase
LFGHWYVVVILLIIALIIFGPKRLPELGEGLGKAIKEFRKATTEMGNSFRDETRPSDTATGTTYPGVAVTPVAGAATDTSSAPPVTAAPPPAVVSPPEAPKS